MARLGTRANPFILRVPDEVRMAEVSAFCDSHHWYAIFEINDEAKEDLADLDLKLNETPLQFDSPKVGRNEPCLCGSGKKFKKCCWEKLKVPINEALNEPKEKICAHCEIEKFLSGPKL